MPVNKIWTKLFSKNNQTDKIALHVTGATVRHHNPFEHLEVPRSDKELPKEYIDKWVIPFYMENIANINEETTKQFVSTSEEINSDIVLELLSQFNWRPKIVGAIFSAINEYTEFEEIIGRHLLKSEVCYAGYGYSLALTIFNTTNSKLYLRQYLDYYLQRKDLWFDQSTVFCALEYLDEEQSDEYKSKWLEFVSDKPNWDIEQSRTYFKTAIDKIKMIQQLKAK